MKSNDKLRNIGQSSSSFPAQSSPLHPVISQKYVATASPSILSFNARSLLPKMSELRSMTSSLQPDIVAVTETWSSSVVPDGALLLPNYNTVIRRDRRSVFTNTGRQLTQQRSAGVLPLIHDSIRCTPRPDLQIWPESCWIEVKARKSTQALIIHLRSPFLTVTNTLNKPFSLHRSKERKQ